MSGFEDKLLTIVIPTYNRINIVTKNIQNLVENQVDNKCKILVIDNDSSDGTASFLESEFKNVENLKIIKNQSNIGASKSFLSIPEYCSTEYFLVTSDEDFILYENLDDLLAFIDKKKPAFIRPQVYRFNTLYCGRNKTQPLGVLGASESSFYISGLIYKTSEFKKSVQYVDSSDFYSHLYPQIVLTLLVQAFNDSEKSLFWNRPITSIRFEEETSTVDLNNNKYWILESRWKQIKSLYDITQKLLELEVSGLNKNVVMEFQFAYFSNIYDNFKDPISIEAPGIYKIMTSKKAIISREFVFYKRLFLYILRKFFRS